MQVRRFLFLLIIFSLIGFVIPSQAQDSEPVDIQVTAGFNGFFRQNFWIPLRIQVRNEGVGISGQISVRPETTGRNIETAYSTPIELPTGSEKNVFLYILARDTADTVLVELITEEGVRVAERLVGLHGLYHQDALHVVVSSTVANSLVLNGVAAATYQAHQARLELSAIPPQYQSLLALNSLILYDVNSEDMTVGQRSAIEQWVMMGGHLIVIGGPNWAQTASSLNDWLPFLPTSSENVDDLSILSHYVNMDSSITGRTVVTTGNVAENARVLVETEDGLPLLIRGEIGLGTVDYLTVDPTLEPLRSWEGQTDFWRTVIASRQAIPGWTRGILDQGYAARSVAILPGVNLLPSVTSMMGFILAYIMLIGPINYWILSRLNRRAWGWVTIPLFIAIFTTLAWTVGFNLRGSEVIVSRQFIVQSFAGEEDARQDELIGIFSPRREIYTISAPLDNFLQVLPSLTGDNVLQPGVQRTTIDIVQSDRFRAENVAIDGGIFANFALTSTVEAPDISGSLTIGYENKIEGDDVLTIRTVRGLVRNDTDVALRDAVILTGNYFYRVEETLEANDILDFDTADFVIIHESKNTLLPLSSPIEASFALDLGRYTLTSSNFTNSIITSQVMLGTNAWTASARLRNDLIFEEDVSSETSRHRSLLYSFLRDQYASGNIGNRAFLLAWADEEREKDIVIEDTNYRTIDTSLYIVELDVEIENPPSNEVVTVAPDQFTWMFLERTETSVGGLPDFYLINPGKAEIRFTPTDGAILDKVSLLTVEIDRTSSYGRELDFSIWNWRTGEWDTPESLLTQEIYEFENPDDYVGPNNVVDVQLALDYSFNNLAASARVRGVTITQTGSFN